MILSIIPFILYMMQDSHAANDCDIRIDYNKEIGKTSTGFSTSPLTMNAVGTITPDNRFAQWNLTSNIPIRGSKTIAKGIGFNINQPISIPRNKVQKFTFTLTFTPTEHGKEYSCSTTLRIRNPQKREQTSKKNHHTGHLSKVTPKRPPSKLPQVGEVNQNTRITTHHRDYENLEYGLGQAGILANLRSHEPYSSENIGSPGVRLLFSALFPMFEYSDSPLLIPLYGAEFSALWGFGKSDLSVRTPMALGIGRFLIQTAPFAAFQFKPTGNQSQFGFRHQIGWYMLPEDEFIDFSMGLGYQQNLYSTILEPIKPIGKMYAFVSIFALSIQYEQEHGPLKCERNVLIGLTMILGE